MQLVIGNKAYSSWSLRPWLLLRQFGLPFEEILVPLFEAGSSDTILRYTPTGKVPCLVDGAISVWESIAICEYLAERHPELPMWPRDPALRAEARALAAEMHAGFAALRQHCPMNVRRQYPPRSRPSEVGRDLARFSALIESLRARFAPLGPFLMGEFGILDAMYVPMATRCRTYSLELPSRAQGWVDHVLALPAMREWYEAALTESWVIRDSEEDGG
ncbi:glutathione S-transferase family protein [Chitinimonas koreensis]|uniref:glutathione S-transferase family protein n=1 Tax=Chitinimonas koreensis TaxID=356302 RepID=UPI00040BF59A|nr:glutathione S-transferase family protein [Chitinimonas koreensis]QNM97333.1 glutathione S-transferase family protein [Chitinimonas koreensis]